MKVDKYKIVVNRFTAELEEPLDRDLRSLVTCEVDIYDVSHPDNGDETVNEIYKAKLVGTTIVKQGQKKPIVAKSKRSQSQKMRQAMWCINPSEEFYQLYTDKIIANLESIIEFLKDK